MTAVDVSVITPCTFEDTLYLNRLYNSLADQPGTWEWLVEIDSQWRTGWRPPHDPRVHTQWVGRRVGVSAARNFALARSQGQIILPLDADDLLEPDAIAVLAAAHQLTPPDIGWYAPSQWTFFDTDGPCRTGQTGLDLGRNPPGRVRFLRETAGGAGPSPPNLVVYTRQALCQAGGWPALGMDEDVEMWFRVSDRCDGYVIGAPLVRKRVRGDSVSADLGVRHAEIAAGLWFHAHAPGPQLRWTA